MPLTDDSISSAAPRPRPYGLSDGGGMFLLVTPGGAKWWRIAYRFQRKRQLLSLGVYPEVSLAEARARRADVRAMLAEGIDPSAARKAERAARRGEEARLAAARFAVDNDGALSVRLSDRHVNLSPAETGELRMFLDATRALTQKSAPCP